MSPLFFLCLEGAVVLLAAAVGYAFSARPGGCLVRFCSSPTCSWPDKGAGPRVGALVYNVGHTYALPLALGAIGAGLSNALVGAVALIWSAHIGMDRALGYGLKQPSGFYDTHLSRTLIATAHRSTDASAKPTPFELKPRASR